MSAGVVYRGVLISDWEQRTRRGHDSMATGKQTEQTAIQNGKIEAGITMGIYRCWELFKLLGLPVVKCQQG